ncbi:divergent PAP2 family protein [Numidum massiliense]|uniref:divergent PAP2 family protein n=1 Tax=Numidum massiliense TaxID=1522315 RepID=UPI000A56DA5A|nr:divergent PAP2 family protein [Numidum massiliense]
MWTNQLINYPLIAALLAIGAAQAIKVPLYYALQRRWEWRFLFSTGGMPSSHSAAVTALATAIGIADGIDSHLFALSVVFAIIVMYDATGVRRQAGMHAALLNQLVKEFNLMVQNLKTMKQRTPPENRTRLKELLGHKPIEVFVGAWFGIFIAFAIDWIMN